MMGSLVQFRIRLGGHVPGWNAMDADEADAALEAIKVRLCERLGAREGVSRPWVGRTPVKGCYTVGFYLANGEDPPDPGRLFERAQDHLARAAQEAGCVAEEGL